MTLNISEMAGKRLIDGQDINDIVTEVNGILDGSAEGTYSGSFTGTIKTGSITPETLSNGDNMIMAVIDTDTSSAITYLTATNGSSPTVAITAPSGGTMSIDGAVIGGNTPADGTFGTLNATTGNITTVASTTTIAANQNAGASGIAGTISIFPTTASKGKATVTCSDQTGNTTVNLNFAQMGQATTLTIPDPGAASASVLLTAGTQTITGAKTFSTSNVTITDVDVVLSATTGTKIGTATTQKLAFYNSTPITQPNGVGVTTAGFTAGSGAAVLVDSTFTGNVGSTAYHISDIVAHLKNLGLIAA